jgi:ABC-2 type transport system ATP-binding protein
VIEIEGLDKLYGDLPAVQGLSFRVAPGEVVGLVGPNGAGKTTTLRSIAGIIIPTRGRIAIGGHDLATDPVAAKRALAFIPDEPHLFEYLTVEEHLRFVGRLYGVGRWTSGSPRCSGIRAGGEARRAPDELSRE